MLVITEIREWLMFIAEWIIVLILIAEYNYDAAKDELKKQRKTKTTKKTTQTTSGDRTTEETSEIIEPIETIQEEKHD